MIEDSIEELIHMKPHFPNYLLPIKKCNDYGTKTPFIPLFSDDNKNTLMLWILTGIITHVEDIWFVVSNIRLRQSNWHGWILTYIYPENSYLTPIIRHKKISIQVIIHVQCFIFNEKSGIYKKIFIYHYYYLIIIIFKSNCALK